MVPVFWSGLFPAPGTQLHKAELAGVLVAVQPVEEQHRARADAAVAVVDQQGDAELRAVLQLEAEPLRRNREAVFGQVAPAGDGTGSVEFSGFESFRRDYGSRRPRRRR